MLEMVGAIGLVAFLVSSVCIGVRCLLLARRTRGVPELAIGLGFVIGAVIGYVPETIVLSTDVLPRALETRVLAVTQVAIRCAAVSVLVFTVRVFRPAEAWARFAVGVLLVALAASWLVFPYTRVYAQAASDRLWYDVFAVARTAPLVWGAIEAALYHRKLRRRLRLGLADPLVADRFRLWSIGLGAMSLLMASTILAPAVGVDPAAPGWVLLESLAGLVGAVALWLAFFPSRAYRASVARRAQPAGLR
jgi:hypothetical protein